MLARKALGSVAFGGLTPLVDTLFILLFAMLAMSDVRAPEGEREVRLELPDVLAEPASSRAAREALSIEIDEASELFVAGQRVSSRQELDRVLGQALGERLPEEVTVEIRADRAARYGVAVEVLEHLRRCGFFQVQLLANAAESDDVLGGANR